MRWQGLNANILSLAGIALALGLPWTSVVVLVEAAHKRIEAFEHDKGRQPTVAERWSLVTEASVEVGPALFFSLLVITLSFLPVFTLEAQEGRLFSPLAFTKTYAMAAAAGTVGDAGAGAHGLPRPGSHPPRDGQPPEPLPDGGLPAGARGRAAVPEGDPRDRRRRAGDDRAAADAPGRRVHAAAG